MDKEFTVKILVMGESGSGKSALIKRYCYDVFLEKKAKPSVGVEYSRKDIIMKDTPLNLQFWDIPRMELPKAYFRHSWGAFIVFDSEIKLDDSKAKEWKRFIDERETFFEDIPLPVVLLVNKSDLDYGVRKKELDTFCKEEGFIGWFETSAKLGTNIDKAVRFLADKILEHRDNFEKKEILGEITRGFQLDNSASYTPSGGCC